jgi:hypothetical protein
VSVRPLACKPGKKERPPPLGPSFVAQQIAGDGKQPRQGIVLWHLIEPPPGDLKSLGDEVVSISPPKPTIMDVAAERWVRHMEDGAEPASESITITLSRGG